MHALNLSQVQEPAHLHEETVNMYIYVCMSVCECGERVGWRVFVWREGGWKEGGVCVEWFNMQTYEAQNTTV